MNCHVCGVPIEPDLNGQVRYEGTVYQNRMWSWGPVPIHDVCRTELRSPFDDDPEHVATWEMRRP